MSTMTTMDEAARRQHGTNYGCGKPCQHGGECTLHLRYDGSTYHIAAGSGGRITCVIGLYTGTTKRKGEQ